MPHSLFRLTPAVLLMANSIWGADFYQNTTSARSASLGGVFLPDGESVSDALIVNPAGLTRLTARVLEGSLDALFLRGSFSNSATTHGSWNGAPGFVPAASLGIPLRSVPLTIGFGIAPEVVSRASWNYPDPRGGLGGQASFGTGPKISELLAFRTTAGIGYRVNSHLSLGATVGWVYDRNLLQAPYIFQSNPVLAGLKTNLDLRTSGGSANASVGLLHRPSRRLEWGLSYQTATVVQSSGQANGNAQQQFASLGLKFRPDFNYQARVETRFPRSVAAHADWQFSSRTRAGVQVNFINWANAFDKLRIALRNGSNSDIDNFVGSTSIADSVPLSWKNQTIVRIGLERAVGESGSFRAGYAHASNPVPSQTLTPLTASLFTNSISSGWGYRRGNYVFDAAYSFYPRSSESVAKSALLSGEFDHSRLSVLLHSLALSAGYRF